MNIKPRTLEKMQYFVGRVCSVFTGPLCRSFDEVRAREHFVVTVQDIDCDGLWGTHPYNNTVSYFPLESIKLITEEVVLDPNNSEHARMIQEYQERTGKKVVSDVSPHLAPTIEPKSETPPEIPLIVEDEEEPQPAFVDVSHMTSMARSAKQAAKAMDLHRALNQ